MINVECRRYKRDPARPVVGLPMARIFNNELLAVDMGTSEGGKFLALVDMTKSYERRVLMENKRPGTDAKSERSG